MNNVDVDLIAQWCYDDAMHGNTFRRTDTLWRESTGRWRISLTKGALMFPFLLAWTCCKQIADLPAIWDVMMLISMA